MNPAIHIVSMQNIGDNIYQRPIIRLLAQRRTVYLETPLPELYSDIPGLKFVRSNAPWRTVRKQYQKTSVPFSDVPAGTERIVPQYGQGQRFDTVFNSLARAIGVDLPSRFEFDLPSFLPGYRLAFPNKPIALVRPVTIRSEWKVTSRSPKPEYINWCCNQLKSYGFYTISIADLEPGKEWLVHEEPKADLILHKGEFDILQTLNLVKDASIVVGGPGWIVPACMAAKTPLFLIFGGRGSFDSPHKILEWRFDCSHIGYSVPPNFCRCGKNDHDCNKEIPNLDSDFFNFMQRLRANDRI